MCSRHGCEKHEQWHKLCQTHPGYFRLWEEGRGPGQQTPEQKLELKALLNQAAKDEKVKGLGDHVEAALTKLGITSDRVEKWIGRKCGCRERKEKLNRLGAWAKKVLSGHTTEDITAQ